MEENIMEKFQRDVKKMVSDVRVPEQKLNQLVHSVTGSENHSSNCSYNRQKIMASIASIFVLAIGSLLIATYFLSTAADQNRDSILYREGDQALQRMVEEGRVTDLSLVATDKNITVTLEEGYLDQSQLALSYRADINGSYLPTDNEVYIESELIVDGKSLGGFGAYYLDPPNQPSYEKILTETYNLERFSNHPEIELHIKEMNGIEGNWVFKFDLEKEQEHLTHNFDMTKEDERGNTFHVGKTELTPTELKVNTKTNFSNEKNIEDVQLLDFLVVANGEDGEMFLERVSSRESNLYYELEFGNLPPKDIELVRIPRGVDEYSYRITPYIRTIFGEIKEGPNDQKSLIGEKIDTPLEKGAILPLKSPIEVLDVRHEIDQTIVYFNMDSSLPFFPRMIDDTNNEEYDARSYKIRDSYIEVTYPKVDENSQLQLLMYDGTYEVFEDLAIDIDLK